MSGGGAGEKRVLNALRDLSVPFERIEIDPEYADTASFCERYGYPLETSANTIVVASKRPQGRHCACVLLATTRLDVNRTVRRLLDVGKASFADSTETEGMTGMPTGGVSPFGLPGELPLYVDARVLEAERIVVGSGSRSSKLELESRALVAIPGAEVIEGLAR